MRDIKILNIFAKTPLAREGEKSDVMSRSIDLDSSCVVLYTTSARSSDRESLTRLESQLSEKNIQINNRKQLKISSLPLLSSLSHLVGGNENVDF